MSIRSCSNFALALTSAVITAYWRSVRRPLTDYSKEEYNDFIAW